MRFERPGRPQVDASLMRTLWWLSVSAFFAFVASGAAFAKEGTWPFAVIMLVTALVIALVLLGVWRLERRRP